MIVLTEGELEFSFDGVVSARKFDGDDHGLSHCMKAVDFIVELANGYLFVEVKDPQASGAIEHGGSGWIDDFTSERADQDLQYKYRDSFLYELGSGRADKPIVYVMLIALDTLDDALITTGQDRLTGKLPVLGPNSTPWVCPFVNGCLVVNIESWNRTFHDYPVRRIV